MTQEQELIFGLTRWSQKAHDYLGSETINEMLEDEKTFDAICYCIEIVSEISKKILEYPSLIEEYKAINFLNLSLLKDKCFVGDNININLIFNLAKSDLVNLVLVLKSKEIK